MEGSQNGKSFLNAYWRGSNYQGSLIVPSRKPLRCMRIRIMYANLSDLKKKVFKITSKQNGKSCDKKNVTQFYVLFSF